MTTRLRTLIALLGLSLLTGCASFRSGETENLGAWPTAKEQKPTLRYVVQGKFINNGQPVAMAPANIKAVSDIVGKAYTDSALFSSVTEGFGDADVLAEVTVTDDGQGSMALAFLSGFTFCVLPATAKDTIITETTYRDRTGNLLGEVKKQDSMRTWFQILLLPGAFIANPIKVGPQIQYDNPKASILAAREHGVF